MGGSYAGILAVRVLARTILLTAAALVAFASNSLLCRLALAERHVDAASFTGVRIASGALVLVALALMRPRTDARPGRWSSAAALVLYAAPFSYAYLRLGAGIGALVLFATVQATMIGWGIARGERPRVLVWVGLALALAGLLVLALPGASAPDAIGVLAMIAAGVGWGAYSLLGRSTPGDPLVATAGNFARSLPFAAAIVGVHAVIEPLSVDARGLVLAAASGAIASGLGYAVWYAALRGLTATRAAIVQLLVPILAAAGGVVLLDESVTMRLALAGALILPGVAIAARAGGDRTRRG
jgi:drug/metabolite transporter (DMT)-like permease